MRQQLEYLVCQAQEGKITYVNGKYAGKFMGDPSVIEVRERMYASCPEFCDFLNKLGAEGWELVCGYSITNEYAQFEKFIFKRPKHDPVRTGER
jgi:hypothetical protein